MILRFAVTSTRGFHATEHRSVRRRPELNFVPQARPVAADGDAAAEPIKLKRVLQPLDAPSAERVRRDWRALTRRSDDS